MTCHVTLSFGSSTISFWLNCASNRLIMKSTVVCVYELLMRGCEVNGHLVCERNNIPAEPASEVHCGKWQTLTRGLLRGLVDRPEDAPLIDRDLQKHRHTKSDQYTKKCTLYDTLIHNNTYTHKIPTPFCVIVLEIQLNGADWRWFDFRQRKVTQTRTDDWEKTHSYILCCLQFSLTLLLLQQNIHLSLYYFWPVSRTLSSFHWFRETILLCFQSSVNRK